MATTRPEIQHIYHSPRSTMVTSSASTYAVETLKAELDESRARFTNLIEGSLQGILIHRRMSPIFVNQAYAKIFGYTREEILGMENILPLFSPEERPRMLGFMEARLQGRSVPTQFEFQGQRKDGSLIWLDKRVLVTEWDGERAIQMTVFDITERKLAEQLLRESEERYRRLYTESQQAKEVYKSLLHSSADPIVICDLEERVQYVSPAFTTIFGWSLSDLRDKPIPFVPDTAVEQTGTVIEGLLADGMPVRGFETQRTTADGRLLDVSLSASRYGDDYGNPAGILIMIHDITEKNEMKERLYQAHKMAAIGRLAGGIAHDFNNILGGIMGYAELVLLDEPDDPRGQRYLKGILKSSERAKVLIRQILTFSRNSPQNKQPLRLRTIVDEALQMVRATMPSTISIRKNLTCEQDIILADAAQIRQVVVNVCSNAAQAMEALGGTLTVSLERTDGFSGGYNSPAAEFGLDHICMSIQDTGPGMAPEVCERIFEPFYTTHRGEKRSGMGLAVVHGIVASHDGRIEALSAPGKGTTVRIQLPCLAESSQGQDSGIVKIQRLSSNGLRKIMLVDDEPDLIETGRHIIERMGYPVVTAGSGEEALRHFSADPQSFSLVITDMTMPNMTGDILAESIHAIRSDIAIIICTGYSKQVSETRLRELGISHFLMKPFEANQLSKAIQDALPE